MKFKEFAELIARCPAVVYTAGVVVQTAEGLALLVKALGTGGYRPMTGDEYDQNVQG